MSAPQYRFLCKVLMPEAHRRGYIQDDDIESIYNAVMAVDAGTLWHVAGQASPSASFQVDSHGNTVWYGGKRLTVGDAGRLIDQCLVWMPDKKPKAKSSRKPAHEWENPNPQTPVNTSQPVSPAAPQGPSVEDMVTEADISGNPHLVIIIPLKKPLSVEQVETVSELVGMFIQSRTTVETNGDLKVVWTDGAGGEEVNGHSSG